MNYLPADAQILVLIGPSGTGKTTLVQRLADRGLIELTPTWTDRPRRPGEKAMEHDFVSPQKFDELINGGLFLHEPVSFFNLPYRYALPKIAQPADNKMPAIMARIMALDLINYYYPNRIIYQIEAPYGLVAQRLHAREEQGIDIGTRLDDYQREVKLGRRHAKRVFVNDSTVENLLSQISRALAADFGIVATN